MTLPNDGPVAVTVDHGEGKVLRLTESGARALVELLRAAASTADCREVALDLESTECAISFKATPDQVRAYAVDIEAALSSWAARCLGEPIGKVDRYTRDAAKEITACETHYQY